MRLPIAQDLTSTFRRCFLVPFCVLSLIAGLTVVSGDDKTDSKSDGMEVAI